MELDLSWMDLELLLRIWKVKLGSIESWRRASKSGVLVGVLQTKRVYRSGTSIASSWRGGVLHDNNGK